MAKLVFQSQEARDHFGKVVASAINTDSYFGPQGLHAKIEYLRTYVDNGKEYEIIRAPDSEGGKVQCGRYAECLLGWGRGDEVSLTMRYRDRQPGETEPGEWKVMWHGGLVKHSDGSWGCHT